MPMAFFFSNHPDPGQDDKAPAAGRREGGSDPVAERPPFDTRELDRLPGPSADDPPYCDWWVVVDGDGR